MSTVPASIMKFGGDLCTDSCGGTSGAPYSDFVGQYLTQLEAAASVATSGSAAFQIASLALTTANPAISAALNDATILSNSNGR
jgi:hypothetical protein